MQAGMTWARVGPGDKSGRFCAGKVSNFFGGAYFATDLSAPLPGCAHIVGKICFAQA
jgi:hypothetical protein